MKPYPYQNAGAQYLADSPRAALLDQQGLGKTVQAIVASDIVKAARVLVIAPAIVLANWEHEFGMWAPWRICERLRTGKSKLTGADVHIVSHSLIRNPDMLEQLANEQWDVVIVDEAHAFKSVQAARTKALYGNLGIAKSTEYLWILTGTIMPNNASELYTHMLHMAPDACRAPSGRLISIREWETRYCEVEETRFGRRVIGNKRESLPELRAMLKGCSLRRLKADVLPDLPESRTAVVPLPAPSRSKLAPLTKLLEEISEKIGTDISKLSGADLIDAIRGSAEYSTYRRMCGEIKCDLAVDYVLEELRGGDSKIVVFAHHTSVISRMVEALADYGVVSVTGSTSADARQQAVRDFQTKDGVRVFVGQTVAAGVGITLHASSDVIIVEPDWTPGNNSQAADRVHRIGQRNAVLVRYLAMADSIDEQIVEALARKERMIREVQS